MKATAIKFTIFFALCAVGYFYLQFVSVENFDLEETIFVDSDYQIGKSVLLDSGNVAHGKPIIISGEDEMMISWINKKDTKLAVSKDGNNWNEEIVPTGVQTATSPTDFGLVVGDEDRLHLAQVAVEGVYVSYRDNVSNEWSEQYNVASSICVYHGCRNPILVYQESTNVMYGIFVQSHHQKPQGVYVFHSSDNGDSWSVPRLVREISYINPTIKPVVSIGDGTLFISYGDDLYHSADGAYTWNRVDHNMSKYEMSNLKTVENTSDLYAVWPAQEVKEDDLNPFDGGLRSGNEMILFSRQVNGKWAKPIVVTDTQLKFEEEIVSPNESFTEYLRERSGVLTQLDFLDYTVSADGSVVGVLWEDGRHGISNLYFTYSPDGGVTWHKNQLINTWGQNVLSGSIQLLDDQDFQVAFVSFEPNYENQIEVTSPTSLYVASINKSI